MADPWAVVVVNYRSHLLLERHLVPLLATLDPPPAVVVVDNFSDDAERAAVRRLGDEQGWRVLTAPNDGFGAGVNLGADAALADGAQVLAVLNPDLSITGAALLSLVDEVRADPATLVGPQVVDAAGRPSRAGGLDWQRGTTVPVGPEPDWLTGACLVTSAALWRTLGGFASSFGMYWEDVDLSVRAAVAGARLVRRTDVEAVHDAGGTQEHAGTRRKSDLYYRANCRSRLVFAAAHLDTPTRLRWALRSPAYARAVLLRGGRRQLLRTPRPLLAALAGTLSGLWYLLRTPRPAQHRLGSHDVRGRDTGSARPVVMLSVPDGPHPNPFVSLLVAALEPDVDVQMFSWRAALFSRYDIFHVQWPESLVGWRPSARAAARSLACVALTARWRLTRTPVVRTVHNLAPHESQAWYQRAAGRLLARAEVARIYLTASSLATADDPRGHVIKHGRYREWFDALRIPVPPRDGPDGAGPTRGSRSTVPTSGSRSTVPTSGSRSTVPTVLFFGMLRPYKGVEELLAAFGQLERPARLRVLGRPHTAQYQAQIEALAAADERTELDLRHVADEELWDALHRATLVVLPFQRITNSGSLILALDAEVPVLVSSSPTTEELAEEVGDRWLRTYEGTLTATVLDEALTWATTGTRSSAGPDLSSRDQRTIGREYVALYTRVT